MQTTFTSLVFVPLLPVFILLIGFVTFFLLILIDYFRLKRLSRTLLRLFALIGFFFILSGPLKTSEIGKPLDDIVLIFIDQSPSNTLNKRTENTKEILDKLQTKLSHLQKDHPHQVMTVPFSDHNSNETKLFTLFQSTLQDHNPARIAGSFIISDGQIHDTAQLSSIDEPIGPVHLLLSDKTNLKDRRITPTLSPAYGLVGETIDVTLKIEDTPIKLSPAPVVKVTQNKKILYNAPHSAEQTITLSLPITQAGKNLFELETPVLAGELTALNNKTIIEVEGIRDRLKVLLVSGLPYNGERVWRNLLKSDPNIDLVHFTILRSANSFDNTPTEELALIPFPTRELFVDKINDFDLIIFDRFARLGLIPIDYVNNIAGYINQGGAFLDILSPHEQFGNLFQTQLDQILPAKPTNQTLDQAFTPSLTELGLRHPVTKTLGSSSQWGAWYHQVGLENQKGQVIMNGAQNSHLLILGEVGKGRTAQLASDQIWLWAKNHQEGGPHHELLRRLSHWLMKEADLNNHQIKAVSQGENLTITIETTLTGEQSLKVTAPNGEQDILPILIDQKGNGNLSYKTDQYGVYTIDLEGLAQTSVIVGSVHEKEFQNLIASSQPLTPLIEKTKGVSLPFHDSSEISLYSLGNSSLYGGKDWAALQKRQIKKIINTKTTPLFPDWLGLLILSFLLIGTWFIENRRS